MNIVSSLFAIFLASEARSQPYLEQNGQVVIEVEGVPPAGDWAESQAIGGYTGDSYFVWDGPNQSQGGNGLLTYQIRIQSAGNYQILWRSRITEGNDGTEGNDTWVSLSGTPISGQHTVGTNVWTKGYHGQLGKWSWQTATKDFDPLPIRQFFSAGLHTIKLSGRSRGHAVDRFVLFKYGDKPYENGFQPAGASQEAALTALPESPRESDPDPDPDPDPVGAAFKRWHRVELQFAGPSSTETSSSPNPFLDFRLQCRFTGPSGQVFDVPGFFDGNGSGGASGNVWRCRFASDQAGRWNYLASFRSGSQVAISTVSSDGSPTSFNGDSGSFDVAESDKSGADFRAPGRGMLINDGGHYLVFRGNGSVWLKGGTDIPENLLAYTGFDNTPNAKHDYSTHSGDWKTGDPDWGSGRGKNLIGALNQLASSGGNNIYFLPMNIGGDGQDTFPTVAAQDKTHYDTSKLAQWEQVFTHADKLGIFMHFQLAETETGNENYHDGGNLGPQRKLFYRELIARFGHHLGIQWDVGEENDYGTTKRKAFAAHIRSVDPYDHPITTHCHTNQFENFYAPLLGAPAFHMTAFQLDTTGSSLGDLIRSWRQRSAAAGVPWVISVDEPQPIENDMADETNGYPKGRRKFLWPTYMSGGGGFEWYIQEDGGGHSFDQRMDNFDIIHEPMRWTKIARDFLLGLPLAEMTPRQGLSNAQYTLAAPGTAYAMYNDTAKSVSVDLAGTTKQFNVTWLNPRSGERISDGTVTGGGVVDLGGAPFGGDAAVSLTVPGSGGGGGGDGGGDDDEEVVPAPDCSTLPLDDCLTAAKSKIRIRSDQSRSKRISYRWKRGEALSPRDLGLPETAAGYSMCFYDDDAGAPALVGRLAIPSGNGHWHPTDNRTFYRDGSGSNSGVYRVKVKSGVAGRSVIALLGRSDELTIPDPATSDLFFFAEPGVTVQFVSSMGVCTESRFVSAKKNTGTEYLGVDK